MLKYTIEGFNQEYAITLRKEVEINGKKVLKKIDCTDLVILRWFVDFYPNMKKINVDDREYAWLTHGKLLEDIPIIDINKRSFIERMKKLVEFGILDYKLIKKGGTFSVYTFGENYKYMISSERSSQEGMQSNDIGMQSNVIGYAIERHRGMQSNSIGVCSQTHNKDISIKDTSIKDKSIKNNKDKKDILDIGLSSDSLPSSSNKKIKEPTQEDMNNQVENAIGKIHPCTRYLINQGLIKENDAYIPNYNYIFYEALEKYDFELVRDVNNYVVSKMLKSETPIKDKLSYFKSSFNSNIEIMYKRRNMSLEEMNDWLS